MNKDRTIALLEEADEAYHSGLDPLMSDREYDELKDRARKSFPGHPYFKIVGALPKGDAWKLWTHRVPMGSIRNLDLQDPLGDFAKWWISIGRPRLLAQPKLDGLSLELVYDKGRLSVAALRGDGLVGENVLRNILRLPMGVPTDVPEDVEAIRGEVLLSRPALAVVNRMQAELGEKPYANCRNAAAGIVRRLDGRYSDMLDFVTFDIIWSTKMSCWSADKVRGIIPVETLSTQKIEEIQAFYERTRDADRSGKSNFCYDGVVVKAFYFTDRSLVSGDIMLPDWARALKFPPEEGAFTVDEINWFVGKTGKLTPVLHSHVGTQFRDKVVHEVTLHNYAYFCRLALAAGDRVSVVISGDVIPKAGEVLQRGAGTVFHAPKECPECGALLRVEETFLWCDAAGCPGKAKALIQSHIREMGIDEVGPELVDKLFRLKLVLDPAGLYSLTMQDLLRVEGFGEKSATKVLDNIHAKMEVTLPVFVASLGIPSIGAKLIEKIGICTFDELLRFDEKALRLVDGIGEKLAKQIVTGLSEKYHLAGRLLAAGLKIKVKRKVAASSNLLAGKSFCFTGDIKEINPDTGKAWSREEVQALAEANGGVIKSGVSKKLDVLVMADMSSASSKSRKAREYGVELLSADAFLRKFR